MGRWFQPWPRYVPVAERQARAEREAKKASKAGRKLEPVRSSGRAIATTFWGKTWCSHLESFSDYVNRLARGRNYLSSGLVVDLKIAPGHVSALVSGSSLYTVNVRIRKLDASRWKSLQSSCAGRVDTLVELLQGRLADEVMLRVCDRSKGLFPTPSEIELECSCPDVAEMCKHLAATLYGVGVRLDSKPELLFTLRGVDSAELVSVAPALPAAPVADRLEGADLGALFGIELGAAPEAPVVRGAPDDEPLFRPGERLTTADLIAIGIKRTTFQNWVVSGVLGRTRERGVYLATERLHERILDALTR